MSNSHLDDELEVVIAQLRAELITRTGELQTMSDEKAALQAHMAYLKNVLRIVWNNSGYDLEDAISDPEAKMISDALHKTESQSLADRDMQIAEKVREACAVTAWDSGMCSFNKGHKYRETREQGAFCAEAIRNLSLSEVISDE